MRMARAITTESNSRVLVFIGEPAYNRAMREQVAQYVREHVHAFA